MDKHKSIEARGLTTGYRSRRGDVVVASGIDASISSGELTCLLGPNGAGKSTLLKTLSAFQPPLAGEVLIEGRPLNGYTDAELAKVIGVVLTEKVTLGNMSVWEIVAMGRSPYTGFWGRLGEADREAVDEAISLIGIEHLSERPVGSLSDGERQKVMIAKALAQETPVIFLDEPTAFLDYPSKVEIMQLLHRLSRLKGKTVFMSTHDLELALQISDSIWLIDKNIGVETGTPEDLALSGGLERFFKREGIVFDPSEGVFKISHNITRRLAVTGSGIRRQMVDKALLRNGIESVNGPGGITIQPEGYEFNGQVYDTIGQLIETVV